MVSLANLMAFSSLRQNPPALSRARLGRALIERSFSAEERFALPSDSCAVSPNAHNIKSYKLRHRSLEYITHAAGPLLIPHSHWAPAPISLRRES